MKYILISILMFIFTTLRAMPTEDPGLPGDDPDLPIDGGVALLLLMGAAYGLKKINEQKETKP